MRMNTRLFTDCVDLVGSVCKPFQGKRKYVSTGAVDVDHINEADTEIVDYQGRPSRANLEVTSGDVLFAKMQGTKKTLMIDSALAKHIYSTGFCAVRAKKGVLTNRCLYHLLTSDTFLTQKDNNCSGATQKAITNTGLSKISILIPTIDEQESIADQLDVVRNIIAKRQEELTTLDDLIKARFVELFGMPGTDVNGWGLQPLGECCELNPKKGVEKRLVPGLEVSFVPMPAVSENGALDASEMKTYDEVKTGFTYFAENDVLFAKITPCMENGKGAVAVGLCNGIGFGSTEFHVLRPIAEKSNPYWVYSLTSFEEFRKDAAANMTGSAGQRRVPVTFLEKYKVALPPIELQEQFASFFKQIDKSKFAA